MKITNAVKNCLYIDSSTRFLYLGMVEFNSGKHTFKGQIQAIERNRDDWLHQAIKNFEFNSIAIGAGPGSFTGLRISILYCKIMSMLQEMPLYFFDSTSLWAKIFKIKPEYLFLIRQNKTMLYGNKSIFNSKNTKEARNYGSLSDWEKNFPDTKTILFNSAWGGFKGDSIYPPKNTEVLPDLLWSMNWKNADIIYGHPLDYLP